MLKLKTELIRKKQFQKKRLVMVVRTSGDISPIENINTHPYIWRTTSKIMIHPILQFHTQKNKKKNK
jgi:hypothetical protein